MKFYIDSADFDVIQALWKTGLFCGVTTNPLILKKDGFRIDQLGAFVSRILDLGAQEIFFQSWGDDAATLLAHGQQLARLHDHVVVKLPATRTGFEAAAQLVNDGTKICITAVYDPVQAVLAGAVGAAYVAPYLGRMNDAGRDGHGLVAQMAQTLGQQQSVTQVLAASVRSPADVSQLAQNGVGCCTLAPPVIENLFQEELTREATAAFETAAQDVEALVRASNVG